MVTVEEVWRLALPSEADLAAGKLSLSRQVVWAAMLRPAPPGFEGLRGGEVALISTELLRGLDPNLSMRQVLDTLAEIGISAIAVAGALPDEAKQRAEELSMPLFVMPAATSLPDLQQAINTLITERSSETYEHEQETYRQLTELAIDGLGLQAIVEKLGSITGKTVVFEDQLFEVRAIWQATEPGRQDDMTRLLAENSAALTASIKDMRRSALDPPAVKFDLPPSDLSRLVSPVSVRNSIAGYLSILGRKADLSPGDRSALARAAVACAIELSRQRAIEDARRQSETALLDDLLASGTQRESSMILRARKEGFDVSSPLSAMLFLVQFDSRGTVPSDGTAEQWRDWEQRLEAVVTRELAIRSLRLPVRVKMDSVTVMYPSLSKRLDELKSFAEGLRRALESQLPDCTVSAGIGSPHSGPSGLQSSYREAEQALSIGTRLAGSGRVTYFGDLGLYRLLHNLKGSGDLEDFVDEMLGKLIEYDRREHADLLPTLEAFFESLNSLSDAARRLHVHRNTMIYRLNRIREITGLDLDDSETRLSLHLALKAHHLETGQEA